MILFNPYKNEVIYSEEGDYILFWTKKWGVTVQQLNDAIIETGSINVLDLKNYLTKKGFLFSILGLTYYLKNRYFENHP